MGKQSGLGDRLYVAGYNVSGDIGSLQRISGGNTPIDVTAINKSGMERQGGKIDGTLEFSSYFNDDAGSAFTHFKSLPTTDVIMSYMRGAGLGSPIASMVAKEANYAGDRGAGGELVFSTTAQCNGFGLEWGVQATPGERADTAATNGATLDLGSASPGAFGLRAYLQVVSFTGTSVTVKIQESSDNNVGDAWADVVGGGFTAVSAAPATQRIATGSINVERYLRVVTTGTFSEASFIVGVTRNETAVSL